MASAIDYVLTPPQQRAAEDEQKAQKYGRQQAGSYNKSFTDLLNAQSIPDDELQTMAIFDIARELEEDPNKPADQWKDPEGARRRVQEKYAELKRLSSPEPTFLQKLTTGWNKEKYTEAAKKNALADAMRSGGIYAYGTEGLIRPTDEQLVNIKDQGKTWNYTPEQAIAHVITQDTSWLPFFSGKSDQDVLDLTEALTSGDHSKIPAHLKGDFEEQLKINRVGAPSKLGNTLASDLLHGLRQIDRPFTAGIGGAIKSIQELTKDAPRPERPYSGFEEAPLTAPEAPGVALLPERGAQLEAFDVPLKSLAKAYIADPSNVGKTLEKIWEHAQGSFNVMGETEYDLASVLAQTKGEKQDRAIAQAYQEAGAAPNSQPTEAMIARGRELYAQSMSDDIAKLAIDNPNITEFIASVMSPISGAVGAGIKAVSKVPQLAKAGMKLTAPLRESPGMGYLPELQQMRKYGDAGENLYLMGVKADAKASALRPAVGALKLEQDKLAGLMNKALKGINATTENKLTLEELNQFVFRAGAGKGIPQAIAGNPFVQKALAIHKKLDVEAGKLHQGSDELLDVNQFSGKVEKHALLENYVPEMLQKPKSAADELAEGVERVKNPKYINPQVGSARGKHGGNPIEDLGKQWGRTLDDLASRGAKSIAIKEVMRSAQESGFMAVLPASRSDDAVKLVAEMSAKTGAEFGIVKLAGIQDEAAKYLLKPGAKTSDHLFIVAKPLEKYFDGLVKITEPTAAVEAYQKFMRSTVRPLQGLWRMAVTIPAPAWHAMNFTGAVGFGYLHAGVRGIAAAPKALAGAFAVHMGSGGKLEKLGHFKGLAKRFLNSKTTLAGGEQITEGNLLKIASEHGIINQNYYKFGREMELGATENMGKFTAAVAEAGKKVAATTDKVTRALGLDTMARVGDDFQKLIVFRNALKGTDQLSIAKAIDETAKFAGDYKRLSAVEREFVKEGFGFYSWLRFAAPHTISQIIENPQRMSAFAKIYHSWEATHGSAAPFMSAGIGERFQGTTLTAPLSMQSPQMKQLDEYLKDPENLPPPDSHEFAVLATDNPLFIGLGFLKTLNSEGSTLYNMSGPIIQLATQFVLGTDPSTESNEPVEKSDIPGNVAEMYTKRTHNVAKGIEELGKNMLGRGNDDAYNWLARARALNDLWPLVYRKYGVKPYQEGMKYKQKAIQKDYQADIKD